MGSAGAVEEDEEERAESGYAGCDDDDVHFDAVDSSAKSLLDASWLGDGSPFLERRHLQGR